MKNKKIIIILIILGLIIVAALVWLLLSSRPEEKPAENINQENNSGQAFKVEFLSTAEKNHLSIPTDLKIQVISRDSEGQVIAYKIIKNDSEIITDLAQVGPISPRDKNRLK